MLGKCLTACLVVSASAWAQTAPPHGPDSNTLETLADYRAAAQAHNRGVQAARLEWEAALQRVPQVSALPNPVLSYGHFIEPVETRVGPQKRRLGLKQSLPWFGTLGLKGDVAEAEARAARARYQSARLALDRDVIAAYADLFYLNAAIDVTESNILLLSKWEDVLRTRYSTGSVNYSDLIKVQVELGILQDALAGRRDQHQAAEARLAALLNLPPHTDFSRPTALPEPEAPAPLDTLQARALSANPELQALEAMAQSRDLARDLAGKQARPNLALGLDWIHVGRRDAVTLADNGQDALMASVALELPLWPGSSGPARKRAAAESDAAEARLADRRAAVLSRLEAAAFRYRDAQRKTELYRDALIPKGRQSLEAAQAAFESGDSDFLNLLDAERALLEFSLSLERARADLVKAEAELDALTGSIRGDQ